MEKELKKIELVTRYVDKAVSNRLELTIMPTEQCNFRCVYCYEDYKKHTITTEGKNNLLKCVQVLLKNCTSLHVGWFGGEPLLAYEEILDISKGLIKICAAQKKFILLA